jgi:hypothetical protein
VNASRKTWPKNGKSEKEETMIATKTGTRLTRRDLLKAGGAGLLAMQILPGGLVAGKAWAATPSALKPETYAALVQVSRDLYPHDQLEDRFYAAAVDLLDQAASDAAVRDMLESGVADLDAAAQATHGSTYVGTADEADRVALLKEREQSPFVQKVRGNLITGLYNNQEVWSIFGYEGESASKGGYIDRGFDDLAWL